MAFFCSQLLLNTVSPVQKLTKSTSFTLAMTDKKKNATPSENSPTDAELLEKASRIAGTDTLEFIQTIDRSQFSLHSWMEAYDTFDGWLTKQKRPVEFSKMLGYLSCCAKSVEGKCYPLDLKDITLEMLEAHGFEGRE